MEENKEKNVVNEEQETLPKGMILCKTCGAKMAKKAKKCPSCGAKNKKPIYKRFWFWVLAIIVLFFIVKAIKRSGLDVKKPSAKLTADEIIKEFYEGEEKGESKYKDTVVAITGKVGNIEEDCFYIDTFAELSTFFSVCVKPADKSVLTSLKKDSVITVSGICDGKSLGSIDIEKAIIDSSFAVNPDYNSPMTVPITMTVRTCFRKMTRTPTMTMRRTIHMICPMISCSTTDLPTMKASKESLSKTSQRTGSGN